ncbi:MAG TPA: septum formation initiator family protein [Syntrophorhabdaceae bacterium]|nr:septum formation initiator family protein [Syntrophorhabdaceae bacterium]HPU28902.1 septum formation initiator family protein [Syntrophorhabdaceae bacterium]
MAFILLSVFEELIKKHGLVIFLIALLLSIIFYEGGLLNYIMMKIELARIVKKTEMIEKENKVLSQEIERLRKDENYLEEVVRMKYGLVREGEKLYRIER